MITIKAHVVLIETPKSWLVMHWGPDVKTMQSFVDFMRNELHVDMTTHSWIMEEFTIKITKEEIRLLPHNRIVHSKTMGILFGISRLNQFKKHKRWQTDQYWEILRTARPFTAANGKPTEPAFGPEWKPSRGACAGERFHLSTRQIAIRTAMVTEGVTPA